MAYDNTSRVSATFNEVGLLTPVLSAQPEVLVLGPASGGESYEKYFVGAIGQAEKEFGHSSPLMRVVHEAHAEGADNISVMRIGGRPGYIKIEDAAGETLTLSPWNRGEGILERYVPIMIAADERLLVYDLVDEVFVYDSEEIYVLDEGIINVDQSDGWTHSFDLNANVDLTAIPAAVNAGTAKTMADLLKTDFTPAATDLIVQDGDDGLSASQVEKYAALAQAYHLLNFRDADIIVPTDVYIDAPNIADDATPAPYGYFWAGRHDSVVAPGVPAPGAPNDKLGYVAHLIFEGAIYTVFTDVEDFISVPPVAASATVATDLVLQVQPEFKGKGGNANTIEINAAGNPGPTVTVTPNADGGVDIYVEDDGTADTAAVAAAINLQLATVTIPGGQDYSDVIVASGGATLVTTVAKTNFTSGAGGHILLPESLTGDQPPAALQTKFTEATDSWFRPTSFDHQLATFCHLASTVWKAMIGTIGVSRPPSVGRRQLASWVGSLPEYSTNGRVSWVGTGDNGSGVLGLKLYAGASGYRAHIPDTGTATDGAAYGGLILTKGTGLPTVGGALGSGFPYGIADGDEALDENGFPVDIGKYLVPTYDWPVLSNGYNGGSTYRGSFAGALAGLIARTPVNKLIIGQYGRTRSVRGLLKIHPTQLDALARIRLTGIKPDDTFGSTLISSSTAAHPNSDYSMLSTIRSVAAVVNGIRRICKPYLGRPFNLATIASIQQEVDAYLADTRGGEDGLHEGAVAQLTYTRRDKILGHMDIRLRMVPPFGIKDINISTSLAADESEL